MQSTERGNENRFIASTQERPGGLVGIKIKIKVSEGGRLGRDCSWCRGEGRRGVSGVD